VFQGGCTLQAAEAVLGEDAEDAGQAQATEGVVLETIARLAERSMVVVEPGSPTRYRMLETLRQYAAEQLLESGEAPLLAARHARFFHDQALAAELELRGHGQRDAMATLRREQPNIRAALAWLSSGDQAASDGSLDRALEMAGSLGLFWHLGRHLEGRDVLKRLLDLGGSPPARARALQAVSLVERPRACLVHPSPLCADTARESLAVFEAEGDAPRAALSMALLAVEGVIGVEPEGCRALLAEAEAQFRADGDEWGIGVVGFVRQETALKTGDLDTAVSVGRAAAARFRQLHDYWGLSAVLYHLGWGLRQFGRDEDGAHELAEAIDVAASAGLYNTVQWALAELALAHLNMGRRDLAADLFARAAAASEHVGDGAGSVLADYGRGLLALTEGEVDEAAQRLGLARHGFATLQTPVWEGWAEVTLGRCAELREDLAEARRRHEVALDLGTRSGEPGVVASALEGLARTWAEEDPEQADALAAQAADVREQRGRPRPPYQDAWHTASAAPA
jgi:tetratricopeptide (TPR) repeat protein